MRNRPAGCQGQAHQTGPRAGLSFCAGSAGDPGLTRLLQNHTLAAPRAPVAGPCPEVAVAVQSVLPLARRALVLTGPVDSIGVCGTEGLDRRHPHCRQRPGAPDLREGDPVAGPNTPLPRTGSGLGSVRPHRRADPGLLGGIRGGIRRPGPGGARVSVGPNRSGPAGGRQGGVCPARGRRPPRRRTGPGHRGPECAPDPLAADYFETLRRAAALVADAELR